MSMQGEENKKLSARGWSRKNILTGCVLATVGYIVTILNSSFSLFIVGNGKDSVWFYIWGLIGFALIVCGISGFWLVIPAFQKWWRTDRRLVWLFLSIGIFMVYILWFGILPRIV